jgi:hypothetical protein
VRRRVVVHHQHRVASVQERLPNPSVVAAGISEIRAVSDEGHRSLAAEPLQAVTLFFSRSVVDEIEAVDRVQHRHRRLLGQRRLVPVQDDGNDLHEAVSVASKARSRRKA